MRDLLIVLDGPAGAGKTTASRLLARELCYTYVDTGALYRGIAVAARDAGVRAEDDAGLRALCQGMDIRAVTDAGGARVWINGAEVTGELRTPEITMLTSAVSARPAVRECLLGIQRRLGQNKRAVFEGRDMGTVVFPDADLKFFLTAGLAARARRRHAELQGDARHRDKTLEEVTREMEQRDANDSGREHAPLAAAPDAVWIDTTEMTLDEVLRAMLARVREQAGNDACL
jgi:cytidylate kinase